METAVVRTKKRVADHGEVLTGQREVNAKQELARLVGFRQLYDFVPKSGRYRRVCRYENAGTGTQVEGQYVWRRPFVRRHLLVGKAKHRRAVQFPGFDWYGSRSSPKFARCYPKKKLSLYRVELELHAAWLRKHQVRHLEDFALLSRLLPRKEFRFVRIDLAALERHLRRRGSPVEENVKRAAALPYGLQGELARLRVSGW